MNIIHSTSEILKGVDLPPLRVLSTGKIPEDCRFFSKTLITSSCEQDLNFRQSDIDLFRRMQDIWGVKTRVMEPIALSSLDNLKGRQLEGLLQHIFTRESHLWPVLVLVPLKELVPSFSQKIKELRKLVNTSKNHRPNPSTIGTSISSKHGVPDYIYSQSFVRQTDSLLDPELSQLYKKLKNTLGTWCVWPSIDGQTLIISATKVHEDDLIKAKNVTREMQLLARVTLVV